MKKGRPLDVEAILREHNVQPFKGMGQTFLVDEGILECIVEAASLQSDDIVLEVGPGVGSLTRRLSEHAARVVAIELDRRMLPVLAETLAHCCNVDVIHGDVLEGDPVDRLVQTLHLEDSATLRYQVVANLPYNITSRCIRRLLTSRVRPERLTLMIQREVAERITAKPGRLSLLAISVQVFGSPRQVCQVPAHAFYPPPKVDSAVTCISVYREPLVPEEERSTFFRVVRAGFSQRRKQLHNSLTHRLGLPRQRVMDDLVSAGIEPSRRPQTLSVDEWRVLARQLGRARSLTSQ